MEKKEIILSGDRPTGKLHLGHFVGSLKGRLKYQGSADLFVMIADVQALTDHAKESKAVRDSVLEVALDYLACGFDPSQATIFIQSLIPELFELTVYFLNLVTMNRLKHNPTVKAEIDQKGFKEGIPAGFVMYPVSQVADIVAFKTTLVPVGADQLPMIEQTNEVVRTFNRTYGDVLVEAKAVIPEGNSRRLAGIDGSKKMSKTLNNAIYLSDSAETVEKKVKKMFTDPNHLNINDPGSLENNTVFDYLEVFDPDRAKLEEMKAHYQRGGLGDSLVKKRLAEVLNTLLEPMRERRKEYSADPAEVYRMLLKGSEVARQKAGKTLKEVRQAMSLNYGQA